VEEELAKLHDLQAERDEIEATMSEHMELLNYE
jgi:type I restriction enzyme M protein